MFGFSLCSTHRMTPLMLATIGFCATLLPYIGDGPRWIEVNAQFYEACRVNWWMNALYIHNLLDASRMVRVHLSLIIFGTPCGGARTPFKKVIRLVHLR